MGIAFLTKPAEMAADFALTPIGSQGLATIRADFTAACQESGDALFVPPLRLCGDNAAMIGCQGYYEYLAGHTAGTDLNAYANMSLS